MKKPKSLKNFKKCSKTWNQYWQKSPYGFRELHSSRKTLDSIHFAHRYSENIGVFEGFSVLLILSMVNYHVNQTWETCFYQYSYLIMSYFDEKWGFPHMDQKVIFFHTVYVDSKFSLCKPFFLSKCNVFQENIN